MRVLVAAVRADAERTSEGACTARVVRLLVDRGHQVRLLVAAEGPQGDGAPAARASVGGGVEVVEVDPAASQVSRLGHRIAARAASRGHRFRTDLPVQALTGFGLEELAAVTAWRRALRTEEEDHRPDVTVARGAGLDLHPLLARAGWGGPWLAHLHDPWPIGWYPPGYAHRSRLVAPRQEAAARRVLSGATVVTAPSARLLAWMAERSHVDLRGRGHVVAHVAPGTTASAGPRSEVADLLPDRPFVLCHAGTVLGARDPGPLLRAFDRFRRTSSAAAADAGLAFVGPTDRRHRADDDLAALVARGRTEGWLAVHDQRVDPTRARAATAAASVSLLIESADPESPFLPAKLADLLGDGGPVVFLSPRRSAVADLVGSDHPLRADPDDEVGIASVLEVAWRAWREGSLGDLRPSDAATRSVAPATVGDALDEALSDTVRRAAPR